jgi:hypothetical protein
MLIPERPAAQAAAREVRRPPNKHRVRRGLTGRWRRSALSFFALLTRDAKERDEALFCSDLLLVQLFKPLSALQADVADDAGALAEIGIISDQVFQEADLFFESQRLPSKLGDAPQFLFDFKPFHILSNQQRGGRFQRCRPQYEACRHLSESVCSLFVPIVLRGVNSKKEPLP